LSLLYYWMVCDMMIFSRRVHHPCLASWTCCTGLQVSHLSPPYKSTGTCSSVRPGGWSTSWPHLGRDSALQLYIWWCTTQPDSGLYTVHEWNLLWRLVLITAFDIQTPPSIQVKNKTVAKLLDQQIANSEMISLLFQNRFFVLVFLGSQVSPSP
jgi:hypothetical protein